MSGESVCPGNMATGGSGSRRGEVVPVITRVVVRELEVVARDLKQKYED